MKPYRFQIDAVNAVIENHRGIISAVTGSGKSYIAALLIERLQVRTLIVTPSVELKTQLTEAMSKWFGDTQVGKNKDIYVENVQALDPEVPMLDYDCVIIDEFHHSASATYQALNKKAWTNIYYRVGLTGTPFRSNEDENILLQAILSDVIYKIDYKKASKLGIIVPIEAYYIEIPSQKSSLYSWRQVYDDLVVKNKIRNEVITDLVTRLHDSGVSTLCLVKEIAHGTSLAESTNQPFVNGQDDDSKVYIQKFNTGEINTIIGTTGVIGEGVDTKPCEYVIIAGLGKAKSAFMQQVGRAVRKYKDKKSAKIIIFLDRSHKFTIRHFKEQCKILKEEYGIIPIKID